MRRMPLYEWGLTIPWCITNEALEAMASIATHQELDEAEIARRMHGPRAPQALAFREATPRDDSQRMTMRNGVACIAIDGPIFRYADMFTDMSGGVTTAALATDFQRALDDPHVLAILFVIDSPGGESTGINELAEAIHAARGRKPLGAYGEGLMASAAYWIASATDVIGVDASAWVGSIGTVLAVPDPTKRPSGSIPFVSSQSPKKRPDPTTEGGRAYLQSLADRMTEVFIDVVMRNRSMSRDQVLAVEGGMQIGSDAIAAGLVDQLASEEEMIVLLRDRAQQATTGRTTYMADSKGFWASFFGAAREEGLLDDAPAVPPAQITAEARTSQPDQQAEIVRLREQLATARVAEASAFVEQLVTSNQALPAERESLTTLYLQASLDDVNHGPITLANGTQTTRVALIKTSSAARPKHALTQELLRNGQNAQQILTNLQHAPTDDDIDVAQATDSARAYGIRANGKKPA